MAVVSHRAKWLIPALALVACDASIGEPAVTDGGANSPDAPIGAGDALSLPDATPAPDAQPCIEGDARITDPLTGVCYIFFAAPAGWIAARDACLAIDAHLVVSTSQEENDVFSPLAGLLDVWVGGNDINAEGQWLWVTGEPVLYTNWRSGEPNNQGADPSGEDCMIVEGDNGGLWDDRGCANTYGYVCER